MKRNRMAYLTSIVVLILFGVFAFSKVSRAGYESAAYKVVEADGKFEIREYPDLMLVTTSTELESQGRDGSFMRLFRYIGGANEAEQKISMTTPVFMEKDSADSKVQMGFVMPAEVAAKKVPQPSGPNVNVRKRAGGRFAVYRFSGKLNAKLAKESETKLRVWMKTKGLVPSDSSKETGNQANAQRPADSPTAATAKSDAVETASYDPPFTPGPLRRNEILIRLK